MTRRTNAGIAGFTFLLYIATSLTGMILSGKAVQIAASFFAVASTIFSYLLLRGRMVPAWLAWVGIVASVLIVVGLPVELAGVLPTPISQAMWLPMLLFEVPLGVWLIVKGVAPRAASGGKRAAGANLNLP